MTEILSRDQFRQLLKKTKPSKFRSKITEVAGIKFASKREAERWGELCLLQRTGQISGLERQPRFPLEVAGIRVGTYIADFRYEPAGGGWPVVEDCKSEPTRTAIYRLKKRMMAAQYGIEIAEI